jgi:hypothetical protein
MRIWKICRKYFSVNKEYDEFQSVCGTLKYLYVCAEIEYAERIYAYMEKTNRLLAYSPNTPIETQN